MIGLVLFLRLAWFFVAEGFALYGHLQSLIVAVMATILAFLIFLFGLLADRIGDNRRLLEEILRRIRDLEPPAEPPITPPWQMLPDGVRCLEPHGSSAPHAVTERRALS